jgi:hypothetical protein
VRELENATHKALLSAHGHTVGLDIVRHALTPTEPLHSKLIQFGLHPAHEDPAV